MSEFIKMFYGSSIGLQLGIINFIDRPKISLLDVSINRLARKTSEKSKKQPSLFVRAQGDISEYLGVFFNKQQTTTKRYPILFHVREAKASILAFSLNDKLVIDTRNRHRFVL